MKASISNSFKQNYVPKMVNLKLDFHKKNSNIKNILYTIVCFSSNELFLKVKKYSFFIIVTVTIIACFLFISVFFILSSQP